MAKQIKPKLINHADSPWVNTKGLIEHLQYGSKETFADWRKGLIRGNIKVKALTYYHVGRTNYLYKKHEVDAFVDLHFKRTAI